MANTVYAAKQKIIFEQAAQITKLKEKIAEHEALLRDIVKKKYEKRSEVIRACKELLPKREKD